MASGGERAGQSPEERLARALFAENCDDEWEDCDAETQGDYRRDARYRVEWLASKGFALYDRNTHVAVSRATAKQIREHLKNFGGPHVAQVRRELRGQDG